METRRQPFMDRSRIEKPTSPSTDNNDGSPNPSTDIVSQGLTIDEIYDLLRPPLIDHSSVAVQPDMLGTTQSPASQSFTSWPVHVGEDEVDETTLTSVFDTMVGSSLAPTQDFVADGMLWARSTSAPIDSLFQASLLHESTDWEIGESVWLPSQLGTIDEKLPMESSSGAALVACNALISLAETTVTQETDYGTPSASLSDEHASLSEARRQKRRRKTKPGDWAPHKWILERLYFEDKMPVKDIGEYMAASHKFYATENMLKKRFKKWGWTRYVSKQQQAHDDQPKEKSCLRHHDLRRDVIRKAHTGDRLLEKALGELSSFIHAKSSDAPLYEFMAIPPYAGSMTSGISYCAQGKPGTGILFLKDGLQQLQQALATATVVDVWFICVDIPCAMAFEKMYDFLEEYLGFLARFASDMSSDHPVSALVASVLKALGLGTRYWTQFALSSRELLATYQIQTRSSKVDDLTRTQLQLCWKSNQLGAQNRLGVCDGHQFDHAYASLGHEFDALISRVVAQRDVRDIKSTESQKLWLQYNTRMFFNDYAHESRGNLKRMAGLYGDPALPPSMSFSKENIKKYFRAMAWLIFYNLKTGELDGARAQGHLLLESDWGFLARYHTNSIADVIDDFEASGLEDIAGRLRAKYELHMSAVLIDLTGRFGGEDSMNEAIFRTAAESVRGG